MMEKVRNSIFKFFLCTTIFAFSSNFLSAQNQSANIRKFIKGNISDKTEAVKSAGTEDGESLCEMGLNFVIESFTSLGEDAELNELAVASVLALPRAPYTDDKKNEQVADKLFLIFNSSSDESVKIAVLSRLEYYSYGDNLTKAVGLINSFLKNASPLDKNFKSIIEPALVTLSKIGNFESLAIIFDAYVENRWADFTPQVENALLILSSNSIENTLKIIYGSNISNISKYFELVKNSDKILKNFQSEIAENVLFKVSNNTENLPEDFDSVENLRISALQVIAENKWARASASVAANFKLAKQNYDQKKLSESQFIAVIKYTAALSSSEVVQALSDCLADFNRSTEKNSVPAEPVMLALISSLGELGDKTAFDNLLYVSYLNYPTDVVEASKKALALLKW
ncbi:hypothetical protein [Treponema zioleckii]|uniref:hypothetical protein n=1 Tax=Treponema zioleckii TaxID=331680 RepID=UPI00168BFE7E|nr:hypothetical protein [Treponema zioleckii]